MSASKASTSTTLTASTSESFDVTHSRLRYGVVPDLDSDVLEAICGSIDGIHDLLAMSQTCSLIWGMAIREILRTHTIRLASSSAIRSFRMFILKHKATHAHHVRSLVICTSEGRISYTGAKFLFDFDDAGRVMDILECTVKLGSLSLSFTGEFRTPALGRISSVFAGLSTLTSLSLADPGTLWAHHALSTLQAPLRTLCVCLEPPLPSSRSFHIILRLSALTTLTSLRLDDVPIHDNSFLNLPQFRSVRSLTITTPLEREPRLDALLHLFPSLDGTLYLRQEFRARVRLLTEPRKFNEIRERNRHAQDVFRWARLDRLDCNSEIARMLALRCAVRCFTIDTLDLDIIDDIRPSHLVLASLRLPFYVAPPRPLRTHITRHYLTHLVVISSFHSYDYRSGKVLFDQYSQLREDIALERLVQTISLFEHATHVRLVFYYDKEGPCEDELETFMRDIRARASAAESAHAGSPLTFAPPPRLLAACPRLRYVFVTAAGRDTTPAAVPSQRRWCHARAWRVVERGLGEGRRDRPHCRLGSGAGCDDSDGRRRGTVRGRGEAGHRG